jgi:hypothetical protein
MKRRLLQVAPVLLALLAGGRAWAQAAPGSPAGAPEGREGVTRPPAGAAHEHAPGSEGPRSAAPS